MLRKLNKKAKEKVSEMEAKVLQSSQRMVNRLKTAAVNQTNTASFNAEIYYLIKDIKNNKQTELTIANDDSVIVHILNDKKRQELSEALKSNCTLKKLTLYNNSISRAVMVCLVKALETNSTLEELCLNGVPIGNEDMAALCEVLKSKSNLKKLELDENSISPEATVCLAESLKSNSTLEELCLHRNRIGDEGAAALCEMLKMNRSLVRVNLASCYFTDKSANAIANMLAINTNLCEFNLGFPYGPTLEPYFTASGWKIILEGMKCNHQLVSLFKKFKGTLVQQIEREREMTIVAEQLTPGIGEPVSQILKLQRSNGQLHDVFNKNRYNITKIFNELNTKDMLLRLNTVKPIFEVPSLLEITLGKVINYILADNTPFVWWTNDTKTATYYLTKLRLSLNALPSEYSNFVTHFDAKQFARSNLGVAFNVLTNDLFSLIYDIIKNHNQKAYRLDTHFFPKARPIGDKDKETAFEIEKEKFCNDPSNSNVVEVIDPEATEYKIKIR